MNLPIKQISEGQGLAIHLKIEPEAKIVQADLGRLTSLKTPQIVGPFSSLAEGGEQFVGDRFDDLPQACQKAPPGFRPLLLAALMRRTDDLGPYSSESLPRGCLLCV